MKNKKKLNIKASIRNNWQLYVMLLPMIIFFFLFEYLPMYGVQIAFRDYQVTKGVTGSEWVGLKHFKTFFDAYYFKRLLTNTFLLNVYNLLWRFPWPIILAIFLNQIKGNKIRRFIQTTIYIPHFISIVVLAGMLYIFLSPTGGIFNNALGALGMEPIDFMSEAGAFRSIYIISGIWQSAGYSCILYVASLSGIDPCLYEAAEIDGASIWKKILHIDLPSILPTAIMVLILDFGKLFSSATNKVLVLQTAGNNTVSDIIGTYVYNVGLGGGQFSYTAAIGLFTNIINFIMIITFNKISKKLTNVGMF